MNFITNQNYYESSFPTPLNRNNLIELSILKCGGGRGGASEYGGDDSETRGGVGGGGMHRTVCLIKWITLHRDTFTRSSSSPRGGEIKGLGSSPTVPFFM